MPETVPLLLPRLQQLLELLSVLDRIVRIVVVHERVHLLGRALHLFDAGHPFHKLLVLVVVTKTQIRRSTFEVPRLVVAAVKADDSEITRRHLMFHGHARLMAWRHVYRDERDVASAEEGQRSIAVARAQPLGLAELDRDLESEHALLALLDVGERARRRQEPGRELKEDGAELARRAQGL